MECIGIRCVNRVAFGFWIIEAPAFGCEIRQRVIVEREFGTRLPFAQPVIVKADTIQITTVRAEGMDVGIANIAPIDKLDAELECGIGARHELLFLESDPPIEIVNGRDCRFADPDGTDLVRLDQLNATKSPGQHTRQRSSGHPASGATTDDDDTFYRLLTHDEVG